MPRAFIIGNGPSLTVKDLEKLQGETTFAVNRIHLLYPATSWRPTYWVRIEGAPGPVITESIKAQFAAGVYCWIHAGLKGYARDLRKFMHRRTVEEYFTTCEEHTGMHYDNPAVPQKWHTDWMHLNHFCGYGSSVNVAIQIAHKLGYGPLYLLGCDLGYEDGKRNHFTAGYEIGLENTLQAAKYANNDAYYAHEICNRMLPGGIFNASLFGALDIYPRLELEGVLHAEPGTVWSSLPGSPDPGNESTQRTDGSGAGAEHIGGSDPAADALPKAKRTRRKAGKQVS